MSNNGPLVPRRTFTLGLLGALAGVAGCSANDGSVAPTSTPSTESTSMPIGGGPWFGLNVPYADQTAIAALATQLDRAPVLVSRFVKLDSAFKLANLVDTGASGKRIPVITIEPWSYVSRSGEVDQPVYSLARLAAGDHDAALSSIAQVFAAYGQRVLVRFAHEMNADWYPWAVGVNGNSPELYVAAWRRVHGLISKIAPRTEWVWAPVAAWWQDRQPLDVCYPGDDFVDYVGVTGYGRESSAYTTFDSWHGEVRSLTKKPALLSETGATGPQKVAWIDSLGDYLNAHDDIKGFVWFNTSPSSTGATGDYRIDDSMAHLDAFKQMLAKTDAASL